jgi:hypothetical protein
MFSGATLDLGGTMGMHLGIGRPDSSPLTPLQRPRAGEIRRGGLETIVCATASTTRIMNIRFATREVELTNAFPDVRPCRSPQQ